MPKLHFPGENAASQVLHAGRCNRIGLALLCHRGGRAELTGAMIFVHVRDSVHTTARFLQVETHVARRRRCRSGPRGHHVTCAESAQAICCLCRCGGARLTLHTFERQTANSPFPDAGTASWVLFPGECKPSGRAVPFLRAGREETARGPRFSVNAENTVHSQRTFSGAPACCVAAA